MKNQGVGAQIFFRLRTDILHLQGNRVMAFGCIWQLGLQLEIWSSRHLRRQNWRAQAV